MKYTEFDFPLKRNDNVMKLINDVYLHYYIYWMVNHRAKPPPPKKKNINPQKNCSNQKCMKRGGTLKVSYRLFPLRGDISLFIRQVPKVL